MKHLHAQNHVRHAGLGAALLAFAVLSLAPTLSWAQGSKGLADKVTGKSQVVVGLNIDQLRSSKHFEDTLEWARANAGEDDLFRLLEDEGDVDLSKDIDAVALSMPQPEGNTPPEESQFSAVIDGDIDQEKLVAAIEKGEAKVDTTERGKKKVYKIEDVELSFGDDGTVWAATGPEEYVNHAWAAFDSGKQSVNDNDALHELLSTIETSKSLWLIGETSKMQRESASGPQPEDVGMSVDLSDGLMLDLLADMGSSDDAKKMVEQIDMLKEQHGANPTVAALGAGPLLANLNSKTEETKLRADTRMTSDEFDNLVASVKQLVRSQQGQQGQPQTAPQPQQPQQQQPQQGPAPGGPMQQNPGQQAPAPPTQGDDEEPSEESPDKSEDDEGSDADFN